MRSVRNTMSTSGTPSDTQDLWHRWWKDPSDPSVGEGLGRWERLPPT